jgi:hypothetical protein
MSKWIIKWLLNDNIPIGIFPIIICDHLVFLHLFIKLALQCAHSDLDNLLDFIGQLALDVLLQSMRQKWMKHLIQTSDNKKGLFFVQVNLVAGTRVGEWCVEPFIEDFTELKILGRTKFKRAHNSGRLFWRGVPVRIRW